MSTRKKQKTAVSGLVPVIDQSDVSSDAGSMRMDAFDEEDTDTNLWKLRAELAAEDNPFAGCARTRRVNLPPEFCEMDWAEETRAVDLSLLASHDPATEDRDEDGLYELLQHYVETSDTRMLSGSKERVRREPVDGPPETAPTSRSVSASRRTPRPSRATTVEAPSVTPADRSRNIIERSERRSPEFMPHVPPAQPPASTPTSWSAATTGGHRAPSTDRFAKVPVERRRTSERRSLPTSARSTDPTSARYREAWVNPRTQDRQHELDSDASVDDLLRAYLDD